MCLSITFFQFLSLIVSEIYLRGSQQADDDCKKVEKFRPIEYNSLVGVRFVQVEVPAYKIVVIFTIIMTCYMRWMHNVTMM